MLKRLVKTKTFWTSVAGIFGGVGLVVTGETGSGVTAIIAGLLGITGRDALTKLSQK